MKCELCSFRGWVLNARNEPVPCSFCEGKIELSWGYLAKKLNEDPDTLARVRLGRSRQKTCLRVLEKIMKWTSGEFVMSAQATPEKRDEKQLEIFS